MNDIWYALEDHTRYVYHYTKAATLTQFILRDQRLLFSRFKNVNDPRECRDWVFSFFCRPSVNFDMNALSEELNRFLKHSWRIGCFVTEPYEAEVTKEREDKGEDITAALYERGHSRPRMWSQYGQDYAGACLVFDRSKLDAAIRGAAAARSTICGPMRYQNPPIVPDTRKLSALMIQHTEIEQFGFERAMIQHVARHADDLFFLKSMDWAQEREWRWVVQSNDADDFYVPIDEALVGITLGDRFPTDLQRDVGRYCERASVSVGMMRWQNGVPQPMPLHWRMLTP